MIYRVYRTAVKKKVNVPDTVTTWPLLIDRLFVSILRGESFVSTFEVRIDFLISKIEYVDTASFLRG